MRIRSSILVVGKLVAVTSTAAAAACGGGGAGKIMADTPALPYQAPDIDEITGIDYPQREDRFVAGLEVLVLAAATSATLAGLSLVTRRRAFSAA